MKIKKILFATLLMFTSLASSCKLVVDKPLTAEQQKVLRDKKQELITKIEDDFPDINYIDSDLHHLQLLRQECINQINEEINIDELDSLYSRLTNALSKIKTKTEYFYELVELDFRETLSESDKTYAEQKLTDLVNSLVDADTLNDIKTIAEEYFTYVSFLFNKEYRDEQKNIISECYYSIDQYLYYDSMVDELNHIVSDYAQQLDLCNSYDDAKRLAEEACALLNAVQTKDEFDLEETNTAKRYVSNCIESIKQNAVVSASQRSAIKSWGDETINCVNDLTSANDILIYFVESCLQILADLEVDLDSNLELFKEIKLKQLEATYLKFLDYRKDDYSLLLEIFDTCTTAILNATNKDDVIDKWNAGNSSLKSIKTNQQKIAQEDEEFSSELLSLCGTYVIDRPANQYNVNYYYEFAEIIDYYLFYQKEDYTFVQDEFRVKVNFPFFDAKSLRNDVYWYCSLMRGSADMYFVRDNDYFVVKLIGYEQATLTADFTPITKRQDPSYYDNGGTVLTPRANDFEDFPYKGNAKKAYCWNSQQLCYALENGYCPVAKPGSIAEAVLNRAKEILRDVIQEGMDNTEKIYQIYSWLGRNASLDMDISQYNFSSDMDERPSENLALYRSYYAESALFDGHTVCDGYAKAYGLMLAIEGIQSKRIMCKSNKAYENTINTSTKAGTGHHEVTYVEVNGNTYCTDPTRSSANTNRTLLTWNHVLFPTQYQHDRVLMRCNETRNDGVDYKNHILRKLKIGTVNMLVSNKTELTRLINAVPTDLENYQFEILFTDEYKDCKEDFLSFGLDMEFNEFYTDEHIKGLIVYPE